MSSSHTSSSGSASRPGDAPETINTLTNSARQLTLHDSSSFAAVPDSITLHKLRHMAARHSSSTASNGARFPGQVQASSFSPTLEAITLRSSPFTTASSSSATARDETGSQGQLKNSRWNTNDSVHPEELRRLKERELQNKKRINLRVEKEDAATISAAEAEERLIDLRKSTRHAQDKAATKPIKTGLFKKVCSADVLFLLDTTSSMQPYINAAKDQVIDIMNDISAAFFNRASVRMAVVAYKDHGDHNQFQLLDFTESADKVCLFLNTLTASGGGDIPEDVLGALHQALQASWKHSTRCIIHITDAPAHGRNLHDLGDDQDSFAEPGSEPHGLRHEGILKQLITRRINYALFRITNGTDRMAYAFLKSYAAQSSDCRLDRSNEYHASAVRLSARGNVGFQGWGLSGKKLQKSPQFHEATLGSSYHHLRHLVVNMVTASATDSYTLTASGDASSIQLIPFARLDYSRPGFCGIKLPLDTSPPEWGSPGFLDQKCEFEAFSTNVVAHGTSLLDEMMASDDNIEITTTNLTVHLRTRPFAKGAMRLASHARSDASRNRLVVKAYQRKGPSLEHLVEEMYCQALCKAFALEFNALLEEKYSLDFIVVTCLRPRSRRPGDSEEFLSLEPWIPGEYSKYNSNSGWINEANPKSPKNMAAQAFSHFTYERSRGHFLVSDLQGVGRVLTDPVVHTADPKRFRLTDTNLGHEGFRFFLVTHKCNRVCRLLGLKTNHEMLRTDSLVFREDWPKMMEGSKMMICCSNKLCSRIVNMAKAKVSPNHPGYRWCSGCFEELNCSSETNICKSADPRHEFSFSPFFYESQGMAFPRECPQHLNGDYKAHTVETAGDETVKTLACKYKEGCVLMDCPFLHPNLRCPYGSDCRKPGCTFRHAVSECRYNKKCTNPRCLYRHPGRDEQRSSGAVAVRASGPVRQGKAAPQCLYDARCKNAECVFSHSVGICPFAPACKKNGCRLRHPGQVQRCRNGVNCIKDKCRFDHS